MVWQLVEAHNALNQKTEGEECNCKLFGEFHTHHVQCNVLNSSPYQRIREKIEKKRREAEKEAIRAYELDQETSAAFWEGQYKMAEKALSILDTELKENSSDVTKE